MGGALKTGKEEPVDAKDTSVGQGAVQWVWGPLLAAGECLCACMSVRVHVCAFACLREW